MEPELIELINSIHRPDAVGVTELPFAPLFDRSWCIRISRNEWLAAVKCHDLHAKTSQSIDASDWAYPWDGPYYDLEGTDLLYCSISEGHATMLSQTQDEVILSKANAKGNHPTVSFAVPVHQLYSILTHFADEFLVLEFQPFSRAIVYQESVPGDSIPLRICSGEEEIDMDVFRDRNISNTLVLSAREAQYLVSNYGPFTDVSPREHPYVWLFSQDGSGGIASHNDKMLRFDAVDFGRDVRYALSLSCLGLALEATDCSADDSVHFTTGLIRDHFVLDAGTFLVYLKRKVPELKDIMSAVTHHIPSMSFTIKSAAILGFIKKISALDERHDAPLVMHKVGSYIWLHWKGYNCSVNECHHILTEDKGDRTWKIQSSVLKRIVATYGATELVFSYSEMDGCIHIHPEQPCSYVEHARIIATMKLTEKDHSQE